MPAKTWTFASGWKVGEWIENQYEIRTICLGNMGVVFLCLDHESNNPVAIKTFQDAYISSAHSRETFLREAETWIRLDTHPNIVRAYFVKMIQNKPYLFLEYVPSTKSRGANLKDYMTARPFLLHEVLNFAIQICDGMIHADKCVPGIVHRDLKPENLLLTPDMTVKITDFGLVQSITIPKDDPAAHSRRATTSEIARMAKNLRGTPAYISPEQCRHDKGADVRSDLYSFGCVLYELLARQKPFEDAKTVEENIEAHLRRTPPRLRSLVASVPPTLQDLVHRCLEKDPLDRPIDFAEVRIGLDRIYAGVTGQRLAPQRAEELSVTELMNKGVSLMNMGYTEEALVTLEEAAKADPNRSEPYNYMGASYYRMKELDKAIECFQNAALRDPKNAMAYCNLGAALEAKNLRSQAEVAYKTALEQDPALLAAAYNLSLLYQATDRYREALNVLTKVREKVPGATEIDRVLAKVYLHLKRYDKATEHVREALKREPDNEHLYLLSASVHLAQGHEALAVQDYEKALDLNPHSAETHYRLGLVHQKAQRFDEAIEEWEEAIHLDPKHGLAHYNLAVTLAMRQRYPMAWIHLRDAEKLGVKTEDFKKALRRLYPEPKIR